MEKDFNFWKLHVVLDYEKIYSYLKEIDVLLDDCFVFDGEGYILKGYFMDNIRKSVLNSFCNDPEYYIDENDFAANHYRCENFYPVEFNSSWTKSKSAEIINIDCVVCAYV